jgi:3-oxo-5alpha-steroid 4-dehydrogenase
MLTPNPTAGVRMGGGTTSIQDIINKVQQWQNYIHETLPTKIQTIRKENRIEPPPEPFWNQEFDVVVVGFGAAGASAAIMAADVGKRVLLVDRFDGGGSTRRSGGIIYAGGGTRAQHDAGIVDSPTNMYNYIRQENGGIVEDSTIQQFCEESPDMFAWLEGRVGVNFRNKQGKTVYYEKKTSYPPSYATLYQSGNEAAHPFRTLAEPAARGNRPFGDYLTGNLLFNAFEKTVENHPLITVALHTTAREIIRNENGGAVQSIRLESLPSEWNDVTSMHVMLHEIGSGAGMFDPSGKIGSGCIQREQELFNVFGRNYIINTPAVIVATGGFFFNQTMVKQYAPKYHGYMPLGNMGDDGSGILLCAKAGGELGAMDRCSAWKFTNPPFSFLRGVLTNSKGERVGNEDTYGATFADFLVQKHDGKGFLIIDQQAWDEANQDCLDPESGLQEDQRMQGLANLHKNCKSANTFDALAEIIHTPMLVKTMEKYNHACEKGMDEEFGKLPKYLKSFTKEGPYYAINLNMLGNKYWPTPCMTLGGVRVEGSTGRVLQRGSLQPIEGLYAAGKCAVGIASRYYVSGLSLADAIFTGRRAGRHVGNSNKVSKL